MSRMFATLLLAILCVFALEVQAVELEELNYTLFTSLRPLDREPSKWYKLSIPSKGMFGPGVVAIKRMDGEFTDVAVFIDKDGIIRAPDRQNDAIIGMDGGYSEKFEVLLFAILEQEEIKPIAKCTITPFPRIIQDEEGHKVELQVVTLDGEFFSINGSGFKPNEQITIKARSCDESISHSLKIDVQGNFSFGYAPAVTGKAEGPFEVTVCGENMKPLKMQHYWGKIAFFGPNKYKNLRKKFPLPKEQIAVID